MNSTTPLSTKSSLISEYFFLWFKSPKKVPNCHYPEHLPLILDSAKDSDLSPLFEDLSQSEKLSEIKPPSKKKSFSQCSIAVVYAYRIRRPSYGLV